MRRAARPPYARLPHPTRRPAPFHPARRGLPPAQITPPTGHHSGQPRNFSRRHRHFDTAGLPTADNTHQVAQRIAPESRIVYVDNDPLVLVHARELLTSSPEGRTEYFEADLRRPDGILNHPSLRETLDLTQPVGLILVSVLPFVAGDNVAGPIVRTLLDAVPSGSYLVLSHATFDTLDPDLAAKYWEMFHAGLSDIWPRSEAEFRDLLAGIEVVEPGIVQVHEWRPAPDATARTANEINNWARSPASRRHDPQGFAIEPY